MPSIFCPVTKRTADLAIFVFLPLNMFLVPIKLRPSKFSPYLILIVFLSPYEKFLQSILVFAQSNLFNLCLKL